MWTPSSEEELESALVTGDLKESHTYEMKRELGSSAGERAETARDLASLAIDGGVLIFGVDENKEQRSFSLSPAPLEGMLEALEQIAALRIDPRIAIHPTEIPSSAGDGTGYVVVVVPPSPNAPHMVQGVYYGRGERTRERLTDAQVVRHQRVRSADGERAEPALIELLAADPVPSAETRNGHLYLVAVPISAPGRVAEDIAWSSDAVGEVARGVEDLLPEPLLAAYPSPSNLQWPIRRERGFAWTSLSPRGPEWAFDEDGAIEFEIRDDGSIRVFIGRLTDVWEKRGEEQFSLIDLLLVANAYRILFWAAELGRRMGYAGAWDIGVAGNGLRGASSLAAEDRPTHLLRTAKVTYPADTFRELTRATTWDIENQPGAVVDRLIGRVLRAIATTDEVRELAN